VETHEAEGEDLGEFGEAFGRSEAEGLQRVHGQSPSTIEDDLTRIDRKSKSLSARSAAAKKAAE
jgi:hypothetical protein